MSFMRCWCECTCCAGIKKSILGPKEANHPNPLAAAAGFSRGSSIGDGKTRGFSRQSSVASETEKLTLGPAGDHGHGHGHGEGPEWLYALNHQLEGGLASVLLLMATLVSLGLANYEKTAEWWCNYWTTLTGPEVGGHHLTAKLWVNEGLMTFFFFSVGLEIKRELMEGALASFGKALLPCIAAFGGIVMPMGIYYLINTNMEGGSMEGVTVPMATDIAFAMGVFSVFRNKMPEAAGPFLLALATVDDLGAIAVIVITGGGHIDTTYLGAAVVIILASIGMCKRGVRKSAIGFTVPAVALWYCLLRGGISADMAGVIIAMCIPMRCKGGKEVIERLINRWTAVSSIFILPLFALANCAVTIGGPTEDGMDLDDGSDFVSHGGAESYAVPLGVMGGLVLGKPLGIAGSSLLAVQLGVAAFPPGVSLKHVMVIGMLGGIGFTMCLFLTENSMTGTAAQQTKIAILIASGISTVISAAAMMMLTPPKKEKD
eukprot:TRINITY_DN3989_c0_g4_i1.p1 TRINITY_DN3989_c0_g4~~TRINITY_DN3989_c0_g4_i1.p1  ORF type:complete len:488 (+),score=89.06 TRINITY_DN3989_c0_g4_i1:113-1576(+)